MKKILLTAILAVFSATSFAQMYYNDYKPLSFGVRGGVTFSNLTEISDNFPGSFVSSKLIFFNVSAFADLRFNDNFSFQPAIVATAKGGTQWNELEINANLGDEDNTDAFLTTTKTTLYYAQVPLNIVFHTEANDYDDLFVGGGPFVGYAIKGKIKGTRTSYTDPSANEGFSQDVSFGSNPGQLKRLDYGLNFILGYKLDNNMMINASYDFGLANLTTNIGDDDPYAPSGKTQTRALSFSIGYLF